VTQHPQRGEIVPLIGTDAAALVSNVRRIRAAGAVPLVGDSRWPAAQWDAIRHAAGHAPRRLDAGWVTSTSGSTGTPRIVVRSAESWSASFTAIETLMGADSGDVLYLPSPPASSLSLFSIAHSESSGLALALPTSHAVTSRDFRHASLFHGTPHALRTVLAAIESGSPTRLRMALVGGSALDPAVRERAGRLGIRVVSYYGAAELSFVAVDHGDGLHPFPGVEVQTREGELWVRSPYVSAGYLTGEGPLRTDADGWCTVGDLADLDGDRIVVRGRSDEAILTASATVVPAEVEATLRSIDGVGDSVVFGFPAAGIGALVAAAIEADPGLPGPDLGEIRRRAAALLAHTHLPRRWFVLDSFPRTSSGKPARAEIVHRAIAKDDAP
jgi:acyl-CoA synthetase (AMP-forming)/AMP-acid ligase II